MKLHLSRSPEDYIIHWK